MARSSNGFERSIRQQIAANCVRTPSERLDALCDLLDAVREMAPDEPEARERRRRAMATRQREREQCHANCRRLLAARQPDPPAGV